MDSTSTHLLQSQTLDSDSGGPPRVDFDEFLRHQTLDAGSSVSLPSNPNGSAPVLELVPCSSKSLGGSSSLSDSSMEESETVGENHNLSNQCSVPYGPNLREGASDLGGSSEMARFHENPLYSAVEEDDNREEIYSDMMPLSSYRQLANPRPEKPWPSNNSSFWSPRSEPFIVKPTGVGAGLDNLGNTCFINAILQCFTHTVPLVQGLRSCNHVKPCDSAAEGFCVLCALCDHINLSLASSGKVISPSKLVDNLNHISSCFERYQQEDAHEFLQCLLDKLERCCLYSKKIDESLSAQDNNIVEQIFGGRLISKLRCCSCGHCSDTYEPLIDLSLEIEDVDSLQAALESFTKLEKIEDPETKFTCENCKEEVSVEKQLMLDQAPLVAAFHLKRFKTDGSYVVKIDKHVEFPLELDLEPYINGGQNNDELKYHLYAIVEHTGSLPTYGHYFSYIRSSPDTWHMLNDSRVTRIEEKYVLSQDAYILFYVKQGTAWFSSLLEAEKLCLDPNISNSSPKSVLDNVDSDFTAYCSVTNAGNCEVSEFKDSSDGGSTHFSSETRSEAVEVNKNRDSVEGVSACFTMGSSKDVTEHERRDDIPLIDASKPSRASDCQDAVSCNEKAYNKPSLDETICDHGIDKVKSNDGFHPLTPPRSPSPDDYSSKPSEAFHIPRKHLKLESQVTCKRQLERSGKDLERQEAMRCLKRNMTGTRFMKLAAAVNDGSLHKRRKIKSSPCKRASPPSARRKQSHGSVMRRVAI